MEKDKFKCRFSLINNCIHVVKFVEKLDLSENRLGIIPSCITKITTLTDLNLKTNCYTHLSLLPLFMTQDVVWHKCIDQITGHSIQINILTKERVKDLKTYQDKGAIARSLDLHNFQMEGSKNYRRRKIWLSINKVWEWEPVNDEETGDTVCLIILINVELSPFQIIILILILIILTIIRRHILPQ